MMGAAYRRRMKSASMRSPDQRHGYRRREHAAPFRETPFPEKEDGVRAQEDELAVPEVEDAHQAGDDGEPRHHQDHDRRERQDVEDQLDCSFHRQPLPASGSSSSHVRSLHLHPPKPPPLSFPCRSVSTKSAVIAKGAEAGGLRWIEGAGRGATPDVDDRPPGTVSARRFDTRCVLRQTPLCGRIESGTSVGSRSTTENRRGRQEDAGTDERRDPDLRGPKATSFPPTGFPTSAWRCSPRRRKKSWPPTRRRVPSSSPTSTSRTARAPTSRGIPPFSTSPSTRISSISSRA